jgi:hypothetical protein
MPKGKIFNIWGLLHFTVDVSAAAKAAITAAVISDVVVAVVITDFNFDVVRFLVAKLKQVNYLKNSFLTPYLPFLMIFTL